MATRHLKASINASSSTSMATARIKTSLSMSHLQSAAYFARQSAKYEKTTQVTEELFSQHRAYVTGSIILSIASIESGINELFLEAIHKNNQFFSHLQPNVPDLLIELWGQAERFKLLEKYQLVLIVAGKDKFNKGTSPYQEVDSAIRLRNALIHYKPEWNDETEEHRKLETRLKSRFVLSPFSKPRQAFFPHRCLSHGCAEWIFRSCVNFTDDFHNRAGFITKWGKEQKNLLKTK